MPDSSDWMPATWGGKAAMFANIRMKLTTHKTALGLTEDEVEAALAICDEYAAVYAYYNLASASGAGLTEWRDRAMYGSPVGSPLDAPPPNPSYSPVADSIVGLIPRFRLTRDGWVKALGYTPAIGEDLMIVKVAGATPPPPTPTITVSGAQHNYLFGITLSGRGDSDQWVVFTRQKGGGWVNAGTYTGKTVDITITPLSPGDPEMVEVQVQLRKNNQDYCNASQIATVTALP